MSELSQHQKTIIKNAALESQRCLTCAVLPTCHDVPSKCGGPFIKSPISPTIKKESAMNAHNGFPAVISRKIDKDMIQTVNARILHQFLEVKTRFNDWINNRISEYEFQENIDYITLTENLVNGGKRNLYYISLDMAKEISMVEKNDKGRDVRRYFLQCEKQATTINLSDPAFLRQTLIGYAEKAIEQQAVIDEQAPKVEALNRIEVADGLLSLRETAKTVGMPERLFFKLLHANGYIFRGMASGHWTAKSDAMKQGFLEHKIIRKPSNTAPSGERVYTQVMVTPKGVVKFAELIEKIKHIPLQAGELPLNSARMH